MEEDLKKKSGLATAGLVLGIIAIVLSFIPIINNFAFFLAAISIIFGIIALAKKAKNKGAAIASLVLGIIAIIITLSLQASWANALNKASNSLNDMSGTNTEKVLAEDAKVTIGKLQVSTDSYGYSNTKLTVNVKNISNTTKSFSIQVEADDASGNRIDDGYVTINNLASGQSQDNDIFTYIASDKLSAMKSATIKVVSALAY